MKHIIASKKAWNAGLAEKLNALFHGSEHEFYAISELDQLHDLLEGENEVGKLFFPHWSHLIPESIYSNYECIVFHMTDLPYGRGGSPLQNLIVRGHKDTVVSAIKVVKEIDAGPIYAKKELSLAGMAAAIFERANDVIYDLIHDIILNDPKPIEQEGEVVLFKRRTPEMSNIEGLSELSEIYDYIRMLDAEGYPSAYIETANFKVTFTNADFTNQEIIKANVSITKK